MSSSRRASLSVLRNAVATLPRVQGAVPCPATSLSVRSPTRTRSVALTSVATGRQNQHYQPYLLGSRVFDYCSPIAQREALPWEAGLFGRARGRHLSTTGGNNGGNDADQASDDAASAAGRKEQGGDNGSVEEAEEAKVNPEMPHDVQEEVEKLEGQVKDLKDQLLRSLAEQENTRRIAKRDVESARQFAIGSFAKSLLDTSDNLARAMDAVPEELRNDTENHPQLATMYEGIQMTDDGLMKAFNKAGLKKFGDVGDKFDPNLHDALFEYADPSKGEEGAGTLGQVMKVGFMLNGRVIRPAEVGVIKK